MGAATEIPVRAEAPTPELVRDAVAEVVSVAVGNGSVEGIAEAGVNGTVGANEEKPPSYTEAVGEADEGALNPSAVDEVIAERPAPAGPDDEPLALDAEVEPLSVEVAEPAVTGVADHPPKSTSELVPTAEPLSETKQAAEENVEDSAKPVADVVTKQAAESDAETIPVAVAAQEDIQGPVCAEASLESTPVPVVGNDIPAEQVAPEEGAEGVIDMVKAVAVAVPKAFSTVAGVSRDVPADAGVEEPTAEADATAGETAAATTGEVG